MSRNLVKDALSEERKSHEGTERNTKELDGSKVERKDLDNRPPMFEIACSHGALCGYDTV